MWMINPCEFTESLCWEDRLLHYNPEIRYKANIDLKLLCESITDPNDPRIPEFDYLFIHTISDSASFVRDLAFNALIAYLQAVDATVAGRYARDICDAVCDIIVDDCFSIYTLKKAQIVLNLFVQLDAVDAVLDATEKATLNQLATDSHMKRKRHRSDESLEAMWAEEEDSGTKSYDTDEEDLITDSHKKRKRHRSDESLEAMWAEEEDSGTKSYDTDEEDLITDSHKKRKRHRSDESLEAMWAEEEDSGTKSYDTDEEDLITDSHKKRKRHRSDESLEAMWAEEEDSGTKSYDTDEEDLITDSHKKRKRHRLDEIEDMWAEEDSGTKLYDTEEDWIAEQKLIKSLQCPTCGVYNCWDQCPTCGIHDCTSCIKEKMQPYSPRIPSWIPSWEPDWD